MKYFLGIDSGGSRIKGVLSNLDASILRLEVGGPGNISVLGKTAFASNLKEVLMSLLGDNPVTEVQCAAFGVAGAGREREKKTASEVIETFGLGKFRVITDAELLHYSFYGNGEGILVGSGTGSFCIFRNSQGQLEQVGGWGYLLGDEGSGYMIGRAGIRHALYQEEMGATFSRLTRDLLSFFGIKRPRDLITSTYSAKIAQEFVASGAKVICKLAAEGEKEAVEITGRAADHLLQLVSSAARASAASPGRLALAGGILKEHSPVAQLLSKGVKVSGLNLSKVDQHMEPAAAAVLLALDECGQHASEEVKQRLQEVSF